MIAFSTHSFSQSDSDSVKSSTPDTLSNKAEAQYSIDTLEVIKPSSQIEAPIEYASADSIRYDVANKKIYIYQKGTIIYQDLELEADFIDLDFQKRVIKAHGKIDSSGNMTSRPHFKQGDQEFTPDTMLYNFETKKGFAYNVKTEQEDGYLHGEKVKMHENKEIHLKGGKYTTCDHDHPHFYINMTKAIVIPKNKIVSGPAYAVIEGVTLPVILPFGFFPLSDKKRSGVLLPSPGESNQYGFYLRDLGLYLGWNDYVDFTLKASLYSLGSWNGSFNSSYKKRYKYTGNFSMNYSSMVVDEERIPGSIMLKWDHLQDGKAHPKRDFDASVDIQTPGFKNSERNLDRYYKESFGSTINYSYKLSKKFSLKIGATHNQSLSDSTVYVTLPALSVTMNSTQLSSFLPKKSKLRKSFLKNITIRHNSRFDNKLKKTKMDSLFWTESTLGNIQNGFKHTPSISGSFKLFKYLNFSPSFNYTERWYFSYLEKSYNSYIDKMYDDHNGIITDTIHKTTRVHNYSTSFSFNTTLFGMYNFGSKGPLRAIRHKITPKAAFSYTPGYGDQEYKYEKYGYFDEYTDKYGKQVVYSRYKDYIQQTPTHSESQKVTFGLYNNFEAKIRNRKDTVKGTKVTKLLNNLDITSGYDFAKDSLHFDKITVSANTKLFNRLTIRFNKHLDVYAFDPVNLSKRSREYVFDKYGRRVLKLDEQWSFTTSLSLNSKKLRGESANKEKSEGAYILPWSLSLTYNYRQTTNYNYKEDNTLDNKDIDITTNGLTVNGNISPTSNWKLTFSTGWDFDKNDIKPTNLSIYRDLHCWEMGMRWIPFGSRQSYEFKINVKADVFQDVKYEKDEMYGDFIY